MPNAVYEPARCIQTTLDAAKANNFPLDLIIFEFTENEEVVDKDHLLNIVHDYRKRGFLTAIDDFGSGYSGINLLSKIDVDVVKLDRELIIDINEDPRRQRILRGIYTLLEPIVKRIVVEGIETEEELKCLYSMGYRNFQGYVFARPELEALPEVDFERIRKILGEKRHYAR
jgi:EAL domain-containing protein (putative c-di-GMP-specific phosphodiesterase class I)